MRPRSCAQFPDVSSDRLGVAVVDVVAAVLVVVVVVLAVVVAAVVEVAVVVVVVVVLEAFLLPPQPAATRASAPSNAAERIQRCLPTHATRLYDKGDVPCKQGARRGPVDRSRAAAGTIAEIALRADESGRPGLPRWFQIAAAAASRTDSHTARPPRVTSRKGDNASVTSARFATNER